MSDLIDLPALTRNRARANTIGPALFLHERVCAEFQERLEEVNRTFTAPAIIPAFAAPWAQAWPEAHLCPPTDTLELAPEAHDLILSGLVLHWANDPVGALVQCRRALRPDGLFLGAMFGGDTLHELRACLASAEAEVSGGLAPRVLPMGEIRDLGALLQRAGFAMPVADSATYTVSYETPWHLMRDLRAMGEANALAGRLRRFTARGVMMRAVALYAQTHQRPDGRIPATFEVVTLSGWAPAPDQPQPLRRGSAQHSLADALAALRDTKD